MTTPAPTRTRRSAARYLAGAALAASLVAAGSPAFGHASIPGSAAFGFQPNPAGGTGLAGSTPPYAASSTPTIFLRVPHEMEEPFNGADDTTVEVAVMVPDGWTSPACGPARRTVNNAGTNNTNQPGNEVPGWQCHVHHEDGHFEIHWEGSQVVPPQTAADSAQFFQFSITAPSPAVQTTYNGTEGTEGFIVDQTYASGAIEHWIPNAAFPGEAPPGSTTTVATGLARTVAAATPGYYTPLQPARILDTRDGTGLPGMFGPGQTRDLNVLGVAGIAPDATSVVLNVTATNGTADSNLRLWPAGSLAPDSSNLNWSAGDTVPNLVKVKVGTGGKISIRNQAGDVNVLADVVGYYSASGNRFMGVQPTRILDTRDGTGLTGPFGPGAVRDLDVLTAPVADDATAVVLNVTVANGTQHSDLRLWPTGQPQPEVSNLNWAPNRDVPNLVIVKVGDLGHVSIRNQAGEVQVIADVVGFYAIGGTQYTGVQPVRVLDTRDGTGLEGAFAGGQTRQLTVTGTAGIPADATEVVINMTVTGGSSASNLRVWPADQSQPDASNLNWITGQTVANLVIAKVDPSGAVSIRNEAGTVHVIGDIVGYFSGLALP